jgi:hypothetical protein
MFMLIVARGLFVICKSYCANRGKRNGRQIYPSEFVEDSDQMGPIEAQICAVYNDPLDLIEEEAGKFNFRNFIH